MYEYYGLIEELPSGLSPSTTITLRPQNGGDGVYDIRLYDGTVAAVAAESVGSYSLTGAAAALPVARIETWAVGTYAVTGSAAAFPVARRILGAAGSYSVTGAAAAVLASRHLLGAAGSYSVTGAAVSFPIGRHLLGAVGSYNVTGAAAAVSVARAELEAVGVYAVTGSSASLQVDYVLGATGSYTLSGEDAAVALLRPVINEPIASTGGGGVHVPARCGIECGSGEYMLAGRDAGMSWGINYRIIGSQRKLVAPGGLRAANRVGREPLSLNVIGSRSDAKIGASMSTFSKEIEKRAQVARENAWLLAS
jgi:hypothetical protein